MGDRVAEGVITSDNMNSTLAILEKELFVLHFERKYGISCVVDDVKEEMSQEHIDSKHADRTVLFINSPENVEQSPDLECTVTSPGMPQLPKSL